MRKKHFTIIKIRYKQFFVFSSNHKKLFSLEKFVFFLGKHTKKKIKKFFQTTVNIFLRKYKFFSEEFR